MVKRRIFYYQLIGVLLLFVSLQARGPQITFKAQPETVEFGDMVVLSWEVPGVEAVYLTNVGLAAGKGRVEVKPAKKMTTYTLISEGVSGIIAARVTIEVKGGRGEPFPQQENFGPGLRYKIAAASFEQLLDSIHKELQDSLGFVVDGRYNLEEKKMVFVTKSSIRPELVKREDSRVRRRRLAYWVEVSESRLEKGKYTFEIRTFIEYQRRKERTWRPAGKIGDLVIHRQSAERLRRRIETANR